jgi:arsenate reductase
MTHVGKN